MAPEMSPENAAATAAVALASHASPLRPGTTPSAEPRKS